MFKKIILALIVIVVAIFIYAAFLRKDLTLPKELVKEKYSFSNSHFIKWKGGEIHYTESGKGFPILMIHGFGGSNYDFKIMDSLLNDKYRVIRIDLPGFGLSDYPITEADDGDFVKSYNEYFTFLFDTLHLDSLYVMGNSLGGMMAWDLTLHNKDKVKKMVLFNSAGYDMAEVIKTANAKMFQNPLLKLLLRNGIPEFLTKDGIERVFYDGNLYTEERIRRVNDFWNREGNLNQILKMASSEKYLDQELIKNISCPTLIIWGKQDKIINPKYAERFHQDIKNSALVMYDSCGHVPMIEKPLQVQRDVLEFLSK